mgnify:CR=1 FL=1
MTSPGKVKTQTGYIIGGISPVAHLNKIEIFIEKSLDRFINFLQQLGIPTMFLKLIFVILRK